VKGGVKGNMSKSIFKVNQNIEIEIKHGLYTGKYNSRIEEVNKDSFEIAIPSKQGHLLPLSEQTWFIGKLVDSSCLYVFKAKIQHVELKQSIPMWVVEKPKEIEKTQRRSYIRIEARLPVKMKIVPEDEIALNVDGKRYVPEDLKGKTWDLLTKDVSGSGAKVISKFCVPEDTKIAVIISLPEVGDFTTLARVVRTELANPELGIYWIGVHFIDLSEKERDKIVRFVFKQQIEMRKRNLL
jgi:c-di-GMP-binding flagellar brake protein YcgR